jgi:Peptidase family M50
VGLLRDLADVIDHFMRSGPGMPAALIYFAVVAAPLTLLHELGHALVAAHRLGGPVHISLGARGRLVRIRLRRLTMAVSALPHPARLGGYASFDASRASARDLLLVALAGPAASLVAFVVAALALSSVSHAGTAHDVLWAATASSLLSVLLSLVPLEFQEHRGGPKLRTDGRVALEAIRAHRAFSACERAQASAMPGSTST